MSGGITDLNTRIKVYFWSDSFKRTSAEIDSHSLETRLPEFTAFALNMAIQACVDQCRSPQLYGPDKPQNLNLEFITTKINELLFDTYRTANSAKFGNAFNLATEAVEKLRMDLDKYNFPPELKEDLNRLFNAVNLQITQESAYVSVIEKTLPIERKREISTQQKETNEAYQLLLRPGILQGFLERSSTKKIEDVFKPLIDYANRSFKNGILSVHFKILPTLTFQNSQDFFRL